MKIKDLYEQEKNARNQSCQIQKQIAYYKTFNLYDCLNTLCSLIEKIEDSGSWVVDIDDCYDTIGYQIVSSTNDKDYYIMTRGETKECIQHAEKLGLEKRIAFVWLLSTDTPWEMNARLGHLADAYTPYLGDEAICLVGPCYDIKNRPYVREFIEFVFNYRIEHELLEITKEQMDEALDLYIAKYNERQVDKPKQKVLQPNKPQD